MLGCEDKAQVPCTLYASDLSPEFQPDGRRSEEKQVEMSALAREKGCHRFEWLHRRMDGKRVSRRGDDHARYGAGKPAAAGRVA